MTGVAQKHRATPRKGFCWVNRYLPRNRGRRPILYRIQCIHTPHYLLLGSAEHPEADESSF